MAVKSELRDQVEAAVLKKSGVTPRNMMGTTSYMVKNRMFAFWVAEGLVAKLPSHTRQEMLDRKAGVVFQGPQGRGFGEWTTLELSKKADVETVVNAVDDAYKYVAGGSAQSKPRAKRKARK
jgi:hypothetical protein